MNVLFISPLDRDRIPNSRDRNIAAHFVGQGAQALVMTLAQNTSRALRDVVRDTLTTGYSVTRDGGETVMRIDPFFNPCSGLNTAARQAAQNSRRRTWRTRVVGALSPLGILRDLTVIPTFMWRALRTGRRFDVCIAYGPWAAAVGWLLKKTGRARLLVYEDQDYEPGIIANRARQRWCGWLEPAMMRKADIAVCAGERLASLRKRQTGREPVVIPNGAPWRVIPTRARVEGPLTLLYMGNVAPWSGLDMLIDALPAVLDAGVSLRVLIVGAGTAEYRRRLDIAVTRHGLQRTVTFIGGVAREVLPQYLAQAHVGLAHFRPEPFRRYAFPLKVVEYMAAGLACIGTRNTETADLLQRYDCGIAVPFRADALAVAVRTLAQDGALRARLQHHAREAAGHFQWEALAAREYEIVRRALSARASEACHD